MKKHFEYRDLDTGMVLLVGVKKPRKKHHADVSGYVFWFDEMLMMGKKGKRVIPLDICPRSGLLMFLEHERCWKFCSRSMQEAYKNWAFEKSVLLD